MADVTLRLVKGSPLTYQEVDDNFDNLNDSTGHFKNRLINGNFDIWQRGTSFAYTSAILYTADRWRSFAGGSGVGTISRQAFTLGQTDVPGEPSFFFRNNRTTAAIEVNNPIMQRLESVRTFAGQTCTWSFWAKVGSGTLVLTPRIIQVFGTGGSPSASVTTSASNITLTTSWQQFSITFTVPSISGKTLGTDINDFLQLDLLETSPFSTFTLDFAQSQFEKGSQATEFEFRPLQTELALCQRYFQKSYQFGVTPGAVISSGATHWRVTTAATSQFNFSDTFGVTMRASNPTVTMYSPDTGTSARVRNTTTAADMTVSSISFGGNRILGVPTLSAAPAVNDVLRAHWTADAEL